MITAIFEISKKYFFFFNALFSKTKSFMTKMYINFSSNSSKENYFFNFRNVLENHFVHERENYMSHDGVKQQNDTFYGPTILKITVQKVV